jgi:phytoene synthase
LRPAFDALFDIDEALAGAVARSTEPCLAAIKLAWWRERLEELDQGKVPAEPRLQAAASALLPRGISGSDLAELELGWAALLENPPETVPFDEGRKRLFGLALRLLDAPVDDHLLGVAARTYGAARAGRAGIFELGKSRPGPHRPMPRRVRPLTALVALARRDLRRGGPPFEAEGTPWRAWTILRHQLTGHI